MTRAEYEALSKRNLPGKMRLSCQIVCDHDMAVHPVTRLDNQDWKDTGPTPEPTVTPAAEWFPKEELAKGST
jgi:Na+-transporting NADH:ubiquinone oxidoreductase subunit NqrF